MLWIRREGCRGITPPGVVWSGFPPGTLGLTCLGLLDGEMDAFLMIQRDRWLSFLQNLVVEDPPFVEQGQAAIEGFADGDAGPAQAVALAVAPQLIWPDICQARRGRPHGFRASKFELLRIDSAR